MRDKILRERVNYIEKATELQAREYGRRLDELNHEKENLREQQQTYVLQETYDVTVNSLRSDIKIVNSFKDNVQGQIALLPALAFILSTVVAFLLHFWH